MIRTEAATEVFYKKRVLRNFAKFTDCQSLIFNKVAGFRAVTLLKKKPWHRCFPVNSAKFLRTPFFNKTPPGECFCTSHLFQNTGKHSNKLEHSHEMG